KVSDFLFHDHFAEDGDFNRETVQGAAAFLGVFGSPEYHDSANQGAHQHIPVLLHETAGIHKEDGSGGQLLIQVVVHLHDLGHYHGEQYHHGAEPGHYHDHGIGERAFDFRAG